MNFTSDAEVDLGGGCRGVHPPPPDDMWLCNITGILKQQQQLQLSYTIP